MRYVRFFLLFFLIGSNCSLFAALQVHVNKGNAEKLQIAFGYFPVTKQENEEIIKSMLGVAKADLVRSGNFDTHPDLNIDTDENGFPRGNSWGKTDANLIVTGVLLNKGSNLEVIFNVFDIFTRKNLLSRTMTFPAHRWRQAAHVIGNHIYTRLTGDAGYFHSKIAYIAETGPLTNRTRRIAIMDQDGANTVYVTDGSRFVMSPRFSPKGDRLLYMTYLGDKGRIIMRDLAAATETIMGDFPGISSAPRFSPDGRSIVMAQSFMETTNIYQYNFVTKKGAKITSDSLLINTSPSFSPDGNTIIFSSDRSGTQQLYTMQASGSNQKRITFTRGNYATPAWSPRGDWVAFTKMLAGSFYIGVLRMDRGPEKKWSSTGERILTSGYMVEGPTWSPNGRYIAYTRQEPLSRFDVKREMGKSKIYTIDLTGHNERVIPTPTDATSPSWTSEIP